MGVAKLAKAPVTDFEWATRLSYFLWNTPPDAELLKLAETNGLSKPGVVDAPFDSNVTPLRRAGGPGASA